MEAFEKSDPPVRYIVGVRMRQQKDVSLRCLAAVPDGLRVFQSAATQRTGPAQGQGGLGQRAGTEAAGAFHFSVITTRYEPEAERLLIYFGTGAIVIQGPGVMEFFDDFANQRATGLKADGKEIISVEIDLPRESQP